MDFEFLDPPALVQEKKKYSLFTVREIGGPDEIIKWREMQAAKESLRSLRLNSRNQRIENFEAESGQKLDQPRLQNSTWNEKLMFVQSERERLAKPALEVLEYPPWEPTEKPKKTLIQRVSGFFKNLWKTSNFS